MKTHLAWALALLLLIAASALHAQVPQLINYQGRVAVGTGSPVNFNGTGQFKFALVDGGGHTSIQATGTATRTGSFITSFTVTNPGSGYMSPPAISVTGGGGTGATATAVLSAGSGVSITAGLAGPATLPRRPSPSPRRRRATPSPTGAMTAPAARARSPRRRYRSR